MSETEEALRREVARLKSGAINFNFVQVSRKHIDALNELTLRNPRACFLLWKLVKAMNKQNAIVISQDSLQKLTGFSRATVQRAIVTLREQKWVEVLKIGQANVYRVNSKAFWTARADGKWATFSAEVVVNFDEQDEETKKNSDAPLRPVIAIEAPDDVIVTGAELGSDEPPEQAQIDFHKRPDPTDDL